MTWVKLDDGFFRHPKARAAGKDGRGLFLASLCWSSTYLTDGVVPRDSLDVIASDAQLPLRRAQEAAERLVAAELWHVNGRGWVIHDFLAYNPSRESVEADRAAARSRMARARAAKRERSP